MNKKSLLSIIVALMLCLTTIVPATAAPVFAENEDPAVAEETISEEVPAEAEVPAEGVAVEAEIPTEEVAVEAEIPAVPEEPSEEADVELINPAPVTASSSLLGDEETLYYKAGNLDDDDTWTYNFTLNHTNKINFDLTTTETLTAYFTLSITDNSTGKVVYNESNSIDSDYDFFDDVTLPAGNYTMSLLNTTAYWMYFDLYVANCRVYTVDDPQYSLNKTAVSICPEETFKLRAKTLPEDAIINSITWSSSNPAIATVDETGLVTGLAVGTATITADIDGNIFTCKVTVKNPVYKINAKTASFYEKQTKQLKVTVDPSSYGLDGLTWKSSNSKVATVNSKGLVKGVAAGTATINAKINGTTVASCKVTVKKPVYKINTKKVSLYVKKTKQLKVTVSPKVSGLAGLTWKSSNPKVASVNSKGLVTAKSKGTATISAKVNGKTLKCTVTVKPIKLNKSSMTVYVKKSKTLKVYGGDGTIKWKSKNKKVATVNSKGVVKGVKPGTTTITAKRNGKTVKCKVTVKWEPETGIKKTKTYSASYANSISKKIVIKGNATIKITSKNRGTGNGYEEDDFWDDWYDDTLHVSLDKITSDGSYSEKYNVYIDPGQTKTKTLKLTKGTYYLYYDTDYPYTIKTEITTKPSLSKTSTSLGYGFKEDLSVVGVKNGGKWSSSNKSIATVNSKGVIKAKKKGTCYIKYTLKTGKVLKCKLKVVTPVTVKVTGVHDVAILNDCYVNFRNNTNKKITYLEFNIKQYNGRGSRVSSPYDYFYLEPDLKAKSSLERVYWVNDNALSCKAYITKVWFSDGTTWRP